MTELHHEQCPWHAADIARVRSVCGCPEGWPKDAALSSLAEAMDNVVRHILRKTTRGQYNISPLVDQVLPFVSPLVDRLTREQAELQQAMAQISKRPYADQRTELESIRASRMELTALQATRQLKAAEAERDALRATVQQAIHQLRGGLNLSAIQTLRLALLPAATASPQEK